MQESYHKSILQHNTPAGRRKGTLTTHTSAVCLCVCGAHIKRCMILTSKRESREKRRRKQTQCSADECLVVDPGQETRRASFPSLSPVPICPICCSEIQLLLACVCVCLRTHLFPLFVLENVLAQRQKNMGQHNPRRNLRAG